MLGTAPLRCAELSRMAVQIHERLKFCRFPSNGFDRDPQHDKQGSETGKRDSSDVLIESQLIVSGAGRIIEGSFSYGRRDEEGSGEDEQCHTPGIRAGDRRGGFRLGAQRVGDFR